MADPYNPLPPRKYAEQVLGKAVTSEQLDKLFELHAAAHPVVEHTKIRQRRNHNIPTPCCNVAILDLDPGRGPAGRPTEVLATGQSICNPRDQWNRRLAVTIAFGRALKQLRERRQAEFVGRMLEA